MDTLSPEEYESLFGDGDSKSKIDSTNTGERVKIDEQTDNKRIGLRPDGNPWKSDDIDGITDLVRSRLAEQEANKGILRRLRLRS